MQEQKMIDGGKYDREITFQQATETQSNTGYPAKTWANLSAYPTAWAQVSYKNGAEFASADKNNAYIYKLFRTPYRADITHKMRIVYESRDYDILTIDSDSYNGEMVIVARSEAL